jgi:hypothetical protein
MQEKNKTLKVNLTLSNILGQGFAHSMREGLIINK